MNAALEQVRSKRRRRLTRKDRAIASWHKAYADVTVDSDED